MTLKDKARRYFTAVSNHDSATVEEMLDENYIQHNPFVPTGRAPFLALLPRLRQHGSRIIDVRILEDGKHVIMHHRWENAEPFGYSRAVAFHIIRFDAKGLIAEHWNVMREDAPPDSPAGSLSEGATRIDDLHRTDEYKSRVIELFESLVAGHEASATLPRFFVDDFLRSESRGEFDSPHLTYLKQHRVFGEGCFALSVSEALHRGTPIAVYDLFRFDDGKIAEHWRIAQEIPSRDLAANSNTTFGFSS